MGVGTFMYRQALLGWVTIDLLTGKKCLNRKFLLVVALLGLAWLGGDRLSHGKEVSEP